MNTNGTPSDGQKAKRMEWPMRVAILITIVIAFILALTVSRIYIEKKIKVGIIREINTMITVPVKVKGEITLSLFKHFPNAAITFRNVEIADKLQKGNAKLLRVQEVSFLCNLLSLLTDKVEFSSLLIKRGELMLYKNEKAEVNYNIFVKSDSTGASNLSVQITKATLQNIKFKYIDKTTSTVVKVDLKEMQLKGDFGQVRYTMDVKGKLYGEQVMANSESFLTNRSLNVAVLIKIDTEKQRYEFRKGEINIDDNLFSLSGFFTLLKKGTSVDFELKNSGKNIQQLFALLPLAYQSGLSEANGKGEYSLTAKVQGTSSAKTQPAITLTADFKNSEIKLGKYNTLLRNINASSVYYMDEYGMDRLDISNFNCTVNNAPFSFKLSLVNLANPSFDFYSNGVFHLSEITPFIPDTILQGLEGQVHFSNFRLKGKKSDFSDPVNSSLTGSGEFQLVNAGFQHQGVSYGNINGLLHYKEKIIQAQNFTLNFLGTDLNFSGEIEHLLPYVYRLSVKQPLNDAVLRINGKLKTQTLNLTSIISTFDKKSNSTRESAKKINVRYIFNIKGNLELSIDKIIYRNLKFETIATLLQISPAQLYIHRLSALGMGGELRCTGSVEFPPSNSLQLKLDVTAVDLDVSRVLKEFENFGQTTLTDKNLKGKLSTGIVLNAQWKNFQEFDERNFSALVDFKIKDGQLLSFEPIRAASKFIRVEDLDNIRFADISNTLRISNSTVEVPEFEIKSSALNLLFSGTHRFDNIVDYHFKINLHKMLANKFRRNQNNTLYIENDPYEGVNIFLAMTGNLVNPKIVYDKASVKRKIQADFKKEKEVFNKLLKNESEKIKETEERKFFDVKDQPQFLDFDEDN